MIYPTNTVTLNIGLKNNPLSIAEETGADPDECLRIAHVLTACFNPNRYDFDFACGEWDGEAEPTLVVQFDVKDTTDGVWLVHRCTQYLCDMLQQDAIPVVIEPHRDSELAFPICELIYRKGVENEYMFCHEFFHTFKRSQCHVDTRPTVHGYEY